MKWRVGGRKILRFRRHTKQRIRRREKENGAQEDATKRPHLTYRRSAGADAGSGATGVWCGCYESYALTRQSAMRYALCGDTFEHCGRNGHWALLVIGVRHLRVLGDHRPRETRNERGKRKGLPWGLGCAVMWCLGSRKLCCSCSELLESC